jgi:hypothetical protein
MSNTNTGGPAFPSGLIDPSTPEDAVYPLHRGLSIRDYFAAKAMQIMWDAYDKGYCGLNNNDAPNVEVIAQASYSMADAMLKAREA